jgi:hypothetical protein
LPHPIPNNDRHILGTRQVCVLLGLRPLRFVSSFFVRTSLLPPSKYLMGPAYTLGGSGESNIIRRREAFPGTAALHFIFRHSLPKLPGP